MDYAFEPWDSELYPIVEEWYRARRLEPIPKESLPCYGFFITSEGRRKACVWYCVDSINRLAFLFDLVSDPANTLAESRFFVGRSIYQAQIDAQRLGAAAMVTVTPHAGLAREAERLGLFESESGMHRLTQIF